MQAERVANERGVAKPFALDSSLQRKPQEAAKLIEVTVLMATLPCAC